MPEVSILSDAQFAALIGVIGSFGAALIATAKWSVTRIVKAIDDAATADRAQAEKFTRLETKIDEIHDWMQDHTPVEHIPPRRHRTGPFTKDG